MDREANAIYDTYITQTAETQVNIPASQRTTIREAIGDRKTLTRSAFDEAHEEIFLLMKRDPFPRFLKSDTCKEYVIGESSLAQACGVAGSLAVEEMDS